MRSRRTQRKVRRFYGSEEKIDLVDYCGIKDPTPYEAVRNLIEQERAERKRYRAMVLRARRAAAAGERVTAL